jgi:hypothetical protein
MAEPILKASRWQRRNVSFYGTDVAFDMRVLNKREAPTFMRDLTKLFDSLKTDEDADQQAQLDAMETRVAAWNSDFVRELFTKHIRLVAPVDLDGETLATALEVYEAAELDFLLAAVVAFQKRNRLSSEEVFLSGSPSSSESGAGPDGSATAATDTASGDSPAA